MSERNLDQLLDAWMDLGPTTAPDRVAAAASYEAHQTRQSAAQPGWLPRRFFIMDRSSLIFGVAVVAVIAFALFGNNLLPGNRGGPAPVPAATPSPSAPPPSAAPTPIPSPPSGQLQPGRYAVRGIGDTDLYVEFTVPDGWSWDGGRYLARTGVPPSEAVYVGIWTGDIQVYADPCSWMNAEPQPATGPSSYDLVIALQRQPMRGTEVRNSRSAPGGSGHVLELTVPTDIQFSDCDGGEFRSWSLGRDARVHEGPGQIDKVWAIDVGGTRLVLDAASFPGTPPAVTTEVEAILDSVATGRGS